MLRARWEYRAAASPLPPRQQTDGWASRGAAGPQLRCGGNDAARAASGGATRRRGDEGGVQRLRRAARAVRSGRGGLGVHRGRVSRHGRCLRVGGLLPAYRRATRPASSRLRPRRARLHRGSVSRHERSREGRARRAGGCAAGLLERRGRGVQQREGPDRGRLGLLPQRARRAPSGRREGGAGSARAGGSANSSDEAGEFNGRGPRAARSAVAAGSAYRGRVARAAARGGQQVGGLPAYSSNEDGEACGCARARRALFVVLVILKKRSGSPPKR